MKERRNYIARKEVPEEVPEEVSEVFEAPVEKKERTGHITGFSLLNVRKEPKTTAPVIAVLKTSDSFIVLDDADSMFFKVKTAEGVLGYSMKKFVSLDD